MGKIAALVCLLAGCGRAVGDRSCAINADCAWRQVGCCPTCTSGPAAPRGCGIACAAPTAGCACVAGTCREGPIAAGQACDAALDFCDSGLACCALPGGSAICQAPCS
jgi:hypothetical protein